MFYPEQTIDGIVGRLGGTKLREVIRRDIPVLPDVERVGGGGIEEGGRGTVRCPVGSAVVTRTVGDGGGGDDGVELVRHFDYLVHTVPPLFVIDVVP